MEKYGVVPPKFTKEWWAYFWDYYKIHTISVTAAVLLIGNSVVQCVRAPKYDLSVLYVNPAEVVEETDVKFTEAVSPALTDVHNNNEILTFIQTLPISTLQAEDEQTYAMVTKLTLELQAGENWLFLVTEDVAKGLISQDAYAGCFMTLEDVGIKADEELILRSDNSDAYGLKLTDNELLKSTGLKTEDMYLLIRDLYEREAKDEKNVLKHNNALSAAKLIAGQQ